MGKNRLYTVLTYKEKCLVPADKVNLDNVEDVEFFDTRQEVMDNYDLTDIDIMNVISGCAGGIIESRTKRFVNQHDIFPVQQMRPYIYHEKIKEALIPYYKPHNVVKYWTRQSREPKNGKEPEN